MTQMHSAGEVEQLMNGPAARCVPSLVSPTDIAAISGAPHSHLISTRKKITNHPLFCRQLLTLTCKHLDNATLLTQQLFYMHRSITPSVLRVSSVLKNEPNSELHRLLPRTCARKAVAQLTRAFLYPCGARPAPSQAIRGRQQYVDPFSRLHRPIFCPCANGHDGRGPSLGCGVGLTADPVAAAISGESS